MAINPTTTKTFEQDSNAHFPIVGIGASAGGLDAIKGFLHHVPRKSGMAFVVIQHLDPNYHGMLPELLQHSTEMKVVQADNCMKVYPDCVYVIPPNKDISISKGIIFLKNVDKVGGLHLPINSFFCSLAEDQRDHSVGVILSGMGSDGALGLHAIKEKSGITAAQNPETANFDSMPRAAIATGLIDVLAPVEELPEKLVQYLQHIQPTLLATSCTLQKERDKKNLDGIIEALRLRTGRDFSLYKEKCIERRIARRMNVCKLKQLSDYLQYINDNPHELDLLLKELLIGVTSFFRDPPLWASLKEIIRSKMLLTKMSGGEGKTQLRAWVPGTSTGEEAYSLAMIFQEAVESANLQDQFSLQIFATDLDTDAINKARRGIFTDTAVADIETDRLQRFFVKEAGHYRITKVIRDMITFAPQDVILDAPFTKIDILMCRNLLIYFTSELHRKLIPLFHHSLNSDGILVLGSAEGVGSSSDLFTVVDNKSRIYKKNGSSLHSTTIYFPAGRLTTMHSKNDKAKSSQPSVDIPSLANKLLLEQFSPAAVLINDMGDIIYISGRTGKYLEPAAGKANWNIHAMVRDELRNPLTIALKKAHLQKEKVIMRGIKIGDIKENSAVDLTVQLIDEPKALCGMLVLTFTDIAAPSEQTASAAKTGVPAQHSEVEEMLEQVREENRILREELDATREKVRSTTEELQSYNEELQSNNEELTSSHEEMQSMNEELQTINTELQSKVDDLSRASNDMKNLLESTDIAIVFVDNAFNVRRFTSEAKKIFRLIPEDAGRALSDIVTDLSYPGLQDDVNEVLRTLQFQEKQIPATNDRWFKVKIMPYRTLENVIDGAVITFSDISQSKKLEMELRNFVPQAGMNE